MRDGLRDAKAYDMRKSVYGYEPIIDDRRGIFGTGPWHPATHRLVLVLRDSMYSVYRQTDAIDREAVASLGALLDETDARLARAYSPLVE
jgi:hypothetical protein